MDNRRALASGTLRPRRGTSVCDNRMGMERYTQRAAVRYEGTRSVCLKPENLTGMQCPLALSARRIFYFSDRKYMRTRHRFGTAGLRGSGVRRDARF